MPTDSPREVGPLGAASIVAGTMLGVGILLTPPVVAAAVDDLWSFFGIWIAGAIVALCGAVAYAELGAMMPRAGGDVVFQREAFGPAAAFASGVVMFALAFAGSIAAVAAAIGTYQAQTLAAAAGWSGDLSAALLGPMTGAQAIAVGIVIGLTAVNALGVGAATRVQAACTAIPLAGLAGLAVYALVSGVEPAPAPPAEPVGLWTAWSAVYFTYAGWPAVVYLAGEVREPGRTLPLGMLGGTLLIAALYLLLCAAFVGALGLDGLARAGEAGSALARAALGPEAEPLVAGAVLAALLASVNGTILGGARVAAALARAGHLPAALGAVNGRGAPSAALAAQAVLACGFALTGTFGVIIELTGVAMMVVGAATVCGLFVLRARQPERPRPYRATGYPVAPALYVVISLAAVVSGALAGGAGLAGLGLLAALWIGARALGR